MLPLLVERRRSCRVCIERDPNLIYNGSQFSFDPPVISYWSQWLGHPRPSLLIVGQDFGDVAYFERFKGRDEPRNRTNDNLRSLLWQAKISVGHAPAADPEPPVFLTNAILCLKAGSMNAPIKDRWVKSCSQLHLQPLLDELQPRFVVGMGKGWMAVRTALELLNTPVPIGQAAGHHWRHSKHHVFAMGHCSGLGLVSRAWQQQMSDWRTLGEEMASSSD